MLTLGDACPTSLSVGLPDYSFHHMVALYATLPITNTSCALSLSYSCSDTTTTKHEAQGQLVAVLDGPDTGSSVDVMPSTIPKSNYETSPECKAYSRYILTDGARYTCSIL